MARMQTQVETREAPIGRGKNSKSSFRFWNRPSRVPAGQGGLATKIDNRQAKVIHQSHHYPSIHFVFTREGFHFGFLIVFILVGAIIRNVNLLVVLAGPLLGMIFFQWRLATRTLSHLSLTRKVPSNSQARRPFRVSLHLRNHKKWLGVWSVLVQDRLMETDRDGLPTSDGFQISTVIDRTNPLSTSTVEYECQCDRRGLIEFGPLHCSTLFPWGLLRSYFWLHEKDQCVVHPTVGTLQPGWRELFEVRRHGSQQTKGQSGTSEGEFYGLRNYRVGDSPRWIHWRSTARRNEPVVRQFERQENIHACVLLDLYRDPKQSTEKEALRKFDETVDEAVEFVGTLANILVGRGGGTISVAIAADEVRYMDKIQSRNQIQSLMDELAIVQASTTANWQEGVSALANTLRAHPLLVVISTRPEEWSKRTIRADDPVEWILQRVSVRWLEVEKKALAKYFARMSK